MISTIRFGRRKRDYLRADPEILRKYTVFEERIAVINRKFDELMTELSKAASDLEKLSLDNEATKVMYEKTKVWDIKNEISKLAEDEPLQIIRENLGLYNAANTPLRGPYRSW
jgi:hypothetical protein